MNESKKSTLLLPRTLFSLKASSDWISVIHQKWEEQKIYNKLLEKNKDNTLFILHDGPIYANGDIHPGHVLNHVLKDIVLRFQVMQNKYVPFICGWDYHGLPIELKVIQQLEKKGKVSNLRSKCLQYAEEQRKTQLTQMQKLGLFTDHQTFYITADKEYEAEQIRMFGELVKKDFIYQDYYPLYWSCELQTALAENEVEYLNKDSDSLYFKINICSDFSDLGQDLNKESVSLLVWTTQPWTILSNCFVGVRSDAYYSLVKYRGDYLILLRDRIFLLESWSKEKIEIKTTFLGHKLLGKRYIPLYQNQKDCYYIVEGSNFIKLSEGTGVVHLAPAFGPQDFSVALKEKFKVFCPLDANGHFNEQIQVETVIGKHYQEANNYVINNLIARHFVVEKLVINHSFAHDWRLHKPLIYRLTSQWFINIDNIKSKLLENIEKIVWYPDWTREKMKLSMIARENWCISRQRKWGVPIPILYQDEKPILDFNIIGFIANIVSKKGSDCWFDGSILEDLREQFPSLINNKTALGTDSIDVWFDSGISHHCILKKHLLHRINSYDIIEQNSKLWYPADLYLEGQDQVRGWYASSLILSTILTGQFPCRNILSHGFVVDDKGYKMSKSLGNTIDVQNLLEKYGPDIIRLWAASANYTRETKISFSILDGVKVSYQKIRNTLRFLLGNLNYVPLDLNKEENLAKEKLELIDYYIIYKLDQLLQNNQNNYSNYKFGQVCSSLVNFCINELSSFYFDINKNDLYCDSVNSLRRRQIVTVFHYLLKGLLKVITPILPHLAEEVYHYIIPNFDWIGKESILLFNFESLRLPSFVHYSEQIDWIVSTFIPLRNDIYQLLEKARQEKIIDSNNQAIVFICFKDDNKQNFFQLDLSNLLLVAKVDIVENSNNLLNKKNKQIHKLWDLAVDKINSNSCERCQKYRLLVNNFCQRCSLILENLN